MLVESLVIILEVVLLLVFPGALTLGLPGKRSRLPYATKGEYCFLTVAVSFCISSILGLAMAYLGIFSVSGLALADVLYSLSVALLARPRLRHVPPPAAGRPPAWILPGILVLAAVLFARPVPYLFGGWDPGVYVNTGIHLERTGKLAIDDPVVASLTPAELDAFAARHSSGYLEKYPGFRLDPARPGRLIPQFYHLFPLWLAVFYRWGGLAGTFWFNPLAGLMALCACFLALRRLWDWRAALMATLLLSLNVAEIWQARFPTSEILSQFLFFAGLYCFAVFNRHSGRRTGILAGVFFGCFFVSHIGSALLLLPLALFYYGRWFLVFRPRDLWVLVPAAAGLAFSLLPHFFFGFGYARLAAAQLAGSRVLLAAAGVLVLGLAAARLSGRSVRRALAAGVTGKRFRLGVALILVAAAIFGYCIRPGLGVENPERTNFLELGWFLTVPGLVLALAGMVGQVVADRSPSRWFLLLVLLVFGGLFLWQQLIHFCYMWAVRRYIVVVIPAGVAFAAAALARGFSRPRLRGPASLVFVLTAVLTALASRPIWLHREYAGSLGFGRWLAGEIKADAPVLAGGGFVDKVPTYLDLALGRRVLPLYRDDREGVAAGFRILTRGRSGPGGIYYLTDGPPPAGTGLNFVLRKTIPLHSVILERCWDHLPSRADREAPDANFEVRVYRADNVTAPGGGDAQGGVP